VYDQPASLFGRRDYPSTQISKIFGHASGQQLKLQSAHKHETKIDPKASGKIPVVIRMEICVSKAQIRYFLYAAVVK